MAVENRRVWMSLGADWPAGPLRREPDLLWRVSTVPHPVFNSAAFARFDARRVDSRLDEVLGEHIRRGLPLTWWVLPGDLPADLDRRLAGRGLRGPDPVTAMAADLRALPPALPAPPGLAIRAAVCRADVDAFAAVSGAANAFPPFAVRAYADLYDYVRRTDGDRARLLVGWLGDQPVSAAALLLAEGAAGLYAVSTIPDARRRGIGAALTAHALALAQAAGCRYAALQAAAGAVELYRRRGFAACGGLAVYQRTP